MTLAQRLYEGINLPGEGSVGLITYMRTDSVNIADSALREIAEMVTTDFGREYGLGEPRRYKTKSRNAQEAHEAIRPTSVLRTPDLMSAILDHDQLRLYRLIWQRTVATQMAEARFNQVGVDVEARDGDVRYGLRATGQTLVFDGFIRVYKEGRDEGPDEDAESMLPALTAEQLLRMLEVLPEQHFTQPPPRFSEASLVKTLEELGIGRPSTYASIISTIQDRGYVRLEDKRFYPEDVGMVVTDKLIEHFPDVVDVNFTAHLEEQLDDIAVGQIGWTQVLHEFNGPFERALEKAEHSFERYEEELDETCPVCPTEGREPGSLQVKLGRFGKFIGCTNYPECRYIRNMDGSVRPEPVLLDETCPDCGRQLQERVGRYGPFVGCSGYPECRYIKKEPPKTTGASCPECGKGELVERKNRFGAPFYSCDRYPECTLAVSNPPIPDHPCPECGSLLLQRPKSVKCWNCGAEMDLEFEVTKPGDAEAEAAIRAAKSKAREARAAAKAKKKPAARKKSAARKKPTAKKSGARKPAVKEPAAAATSAAAEASPEV
jgi:DNA topoisomerase-1